MKKIHKNQNFTTGMKKKLVSVVIVTKDRKKDLIECIESYLNSSYKPIEIIVVDNASKPPVITWLPNKYKEVKVITSDENLGAAEGRNIGLKHSKGEYIIFTDDDAYAGERMVEKLVDVFEKKKSAGLPVGEAGIVQPFVYDKQKKDMLQGAGHDFDLLTGRLKAWGVREKDRGQYGGIREVPMCGCVWMVKREVFEKIGNYDEDYFIPYEDSDFSIRARKAGFKNYCVSSAKTWHQGPKETFVHPRLEWLGITSARRAYRIARNKMIFMRKHSPFPKNLFFFFVLLPGYLVVHTVVIASTFRFDVLGLYWLGVISGIWYSLFYPFMGIRRWYEELDKNLEGVKRFIEAWTDPLPWVIDKKSKTILDLASGLGRPMTLINKRMEVERSVGVELFEPYIEKARKEGIHDKYIVKDIREVDFRDNSFDVVIASHVLEHLEKDEAWKVLDKMENIAKRQVIIATPIGEMYHHAEDGNILQLHKSHFIPEEFENRGYKTVKYGWRWLLGEEGVVHKVKSDVLRKVLFALNILFVPIYYIIPQVCDYTFVAYKNFK